MVHLTKRDWVVSEEEEEEERRRKKFDRITLLVLHTYLTAVKTCYNPPTYSLE